MLEHPPRRHNARGARAGIVTVMAAKKKTTSRPRGRGGPTRLTADHRVVVLHGKEAHLRDLHTEALKGALAERFGEFETVRFAGADAALADVLDECRSLGLMQQHRLVIVDEADRFVSADTRPALERYAQRPSDSATLLLRADTWRRGNLDKAVAEVGAVVKCEALSPADAAVWAHKRAQKRHGAEFEPAALAALIDRVGADLGRLDAEIAKLAAMVDAGPVTADLVRQSVGLTREEEVWVIQGRVLAGSAEPALAAVRESLGPSKQPPALVAYALIDLARKLHTASALLRRGVPEMQVSRQAKIWGEAQRPILAAARRAQPADLASLLDDAVETDARCKTGRADPARALEALALRFASL
ncbi:MAG: DNA polymerase III subunit delta [Planctomycetota bacterium]|nr:MAG: DNA polymerase III subunit delta [Planctomycetota bacterium]